MIDVQNLSKKFGSIEVLKEINITFETGKIYGIVDENGAGKTTCSGVFQDWSVLLERWSLTLLH
jgi:ABC-type multidrug transport system ATPase subunit